MGRVYHQCHFCGIQIIKPSFVYVGSGNLTEGGLKNNVECGLVASADGYIRGAAEAFAALWNSADPADDTALRNYAADYKR